MVQSGCWVLRMCLSFGLSGPYTLHSHPSIGGDLRDLAKMFEETKRLTSASQATALSAVEVPEGGLQGPIGPCFLEAELRAGGWRAI